MKRFAVIMLVAAVAGGAAFWLLAPEGPDGPSPYLGYVEGESILVAPKRTGRLIELAVREGAMVAAGQRLFALDDADERAAVEEAAARLEQAEAELADLHAARQRPAQIEALEARRRQAEAALELSRVELERQERLRDQGVIAEARLDQARATFRRDQNALAEVRQDIEAARLPGREAEIDAAEAAVEAGAAALERARIALADCAVAAPAGGRVLDTLYRMGEVIAAGEPVVEVLPPENIVVRFYVPEPEIARLSHGDPVAIACDGCPPGLSGEISFVASEVEFTPPVIFSREERAKLVFLVEARPTAALPALRPGLPVEVRPQ